MGKDLVVGEQKRVQCRVNGALVGVEHFMAACYLRLTFCRRVAEQQSSHFPSRSPAFFR